MAYYHNGYVINRFPIMTFLAYCVAKKAGFNESLAKQLGYGVATYYAILKNVGTGGGAFYRPEKRIEPTLDDKLIDELPLKEFQKLKYVDFCGATFVIKDNQVLGISTIRGRQNGFDECKFDWQIEKIKAIKNGALEHLKNEIEKVIKNISIKELTGRQFFHLWKSIRDEFRTKEFYGLI